MLLIKINIIIILVLPGFRFPRHLHVIFHYYILYAFLCVINVNCFLCVKIHNKIIKIIARSQHAGSLSFKLNQLRVVTGNIPVFIENRKIHPQIMFPNALLRGSR